MEWAIVVDFDFTIVSVKPALSKSDGCEVDAMVCAIPKPKAFRVFDPNR